MALSNFFIIGAAKAGTTSLHFYLDQHPQVQMSVNKEPHFFAGTSTGIPFPMGHVSKLRDYERLFDPAFEVRGEASPSYAAHPRRQGVPERIKKMIPEARFIYLVRDPIDRTVSHYQHAVAAGNEIRTLKQALADEVEDPYSYLTCQSFYARQLRRYLEHFPEERLMVIDQQELLNKRRETLKRVFAFLSVDEEFRLAAVRSRTAQERRPTNRDFGLHAVTQARHRGPYRSHSGEIAAIGSEIDRAHLSSSRADPHPR